MPLPDLLSIKQYLRISFEDDDALLGILRESAIAAAGVSAITQRQAHAMPLGASVRYVLNVTCQRRVVGSRQIASSIKARTSASCG